MWLHSVLWKHFGFLPVWNKNSFRLPRKSVPWQCHFLPSQIAVLTRWLIFLALWWILEKLWKELWKGITPPMQIPWCPHLSRYIQFISPWLWCFCFQPATGILIDDRQMSQSFPAFSSLKNTQTKEPIIFLEKIMQPVGIRVCLQHFFRASCSYWKDFSWARTRTFQFPHASVESCVQTQDSIFQVRNRIFHPGYAGLEASVEKEKAIQIVFSGYHS